ncbi:hypothetical protein HDU97_003156 [Phlyctochytrium planicorne]|nr:hypothetical protein HDU97_003156 [Phlyctochytrium planicorne]
MDSPSAMPGQTANDFPKDFYELLQIPRTADKDAIKKAYRKQALKYHPDKVGQDPEKVARFQAISRANEILSDDKKRGIYDKYGEQGVLMMDKVPFLDPELLLSLNRTIVVATLFVVALLLFPVFISLRADDKVSWSWPVVFVPAFLAILACITFVALSANEADDDEEDDEEARRKREEDADLTPEEREKKKKRSTITEKIGAGAYLGIILAFLVLLSLALNGSITSWWIVFVPLFLLETIHTVMGIFKLVVKLSKGLVVAIQPAGSQGDDDEAAYEVISKEWSATEKLGFIVDAIVQRALRFAFLVLVPMKLSNPDGISWTVAFLPLFALGGLELVTIIGGCVYARTDKSVPPAVNDERRSTFTVRLVTLIIVGTLFYTTIGLLIKRLNNATPEYDPKSPSSAVILIPVFIVLSILLLIVGCCLPLLLFLTRMGLQAELNKGKEEGTWMRSIVPSDHRITN